MIDNQGPLALHDRTVQAGDGFEYLCAVLEVQEVTVGEVVRSRRDLVMEVEMEPGLNPGLVAQEFETHLARKVMWSGET